MFCVKFRFLMHTCIILIFVFVVHYTFLCAVVCCFIYIYFLWALVKKKAAALTKKEKEYVHKNMLEKMKWTTRKTQSIRYLFVVSLFFFTYFYFICNRTKTKYLNYKHKWHSLIIVHWIHKPKKPTNQKSPQAVMYYHKTCCYNSLKC